MLQQNTSEKAIKRARKLRKSMGVTESFLWEKLRDRRMHFKFRRQFPFGPFVLDFYCSEAKLCVELDGEQHEMSREYDQSRDAYCLEKGVLTLRIGTLNLLEDREAAIEEIYRLCVERSGRDPRKDLV